MENENLTSFEYNMAFIGCRQQLKHTAGRQNSCIAVHCPKSTSPLRCNLHREVLKFTDKNHIQYFSNKPLITNLYCC